MSYREFAESLADISGPIIQKYYRNLEAVEYKQDASPVTIADREVEQALREKIQATYPEHGIIGEEFENVNETAEYVWVLDPIDGTQSFIAGRPIFCTLIALTHHGKPIIGVVDQPILQERYSGEIGKGATLNGKPIRVAAPKKIKDSILATTGPQYFTPEKLAQFNRLAANAKSVIYGGDSYNYALLASGHIDYVVESGLKWHDVAALHALILSAGGDVRQWSGAALNYQTVFFDVVAASAVHQKGLSALASAVD